MVKYQIWNGTDDVITPVGEYLTAAQWLERYPAAAHIPFVVAAGAVNGAFCSSLAQMVSVYEAAGCDFSACTSDEDKLAAIEAFEMARDEAAAQTAATMTENETRAADALEDLVVLQLNDVQV